MISKVYISHDEEDEAQALELSRALWRVGLDSYVNAHYPCDGVGRAERVSFGIRNSECMVALITKAGSASTTVAQEVGYARALDQLIIPLIEDGAGLPFIIEGKRSITFNDAGLSDAVGRLLRTLRELGRLEWLKVSCPRCGEEMTQYLTTQEEVDNALAKGSFLETVCSYCQNKISLDPRTFAPVQ